MDKNKTEEKIITISIPEKDTKKKITEIVHNTNI